MSFGYRGDPRWLVDHPLHGAGDGTTYGCAAVIGPHHRELAIIFSNGEDWEHVSVSTARRCPNWDEMCFVKDLFWEADDCVVQFHPPRGKYVNNHPYCLHLWRPIGRDIETPPELLVGVPGFTATR